MPRKPMVYRNMVIADCDCLCCLVESEKLTHRHAYICRPPANHRDLMKRASKIIDNDIVRVVSIQNVKYKRVLYGIDLDAFIRYAQVIRSEDISSDTAAQEIQEESK